MDFNRERDYIYQELLKDYTRDDIEWNARKISTDYKRYSIPYPEIAKQRLLRSKYMSMNKIASAVEAIKLLLLHRGYITMEQIGFLKLFSDKSDSASTMLTRLLKGGGPDKKAVLKSQTINSNIGQEKVYYLTTQAKRQLLEMFPEKYISDSMIDTSDRAPSLGQQLQHDVELLNVFYYLLIDYNFITFKWLSNIEFNHCENPNALIRSLVSRQGFKEGGILRPDAVLISEEDEPHLSSLAVFVEQDMRTEREGSLKEKFAGYAEFYSGRNKNCLSQEEIIFSVSLKGEGTNAMGGLKDKAKDGDSISDIVRTKNEVMALMQEKNTKDSDALLKDLNKVLNEHRGSRKSSIKLVTSALEKIAFIEDAIVFAPNVDLPDALNAFEKSLKERAERIKASQLGKISEKSLKKRLDVVRAAAIAEPAFRQMLLGGYSLHVIDSSRPDKLPYLLLQGYQTYEELAAVVKRKYLKKNMKHTFEPSCTFMNGERAFVLKNCVRCTTDEIPIVFENISTDVGGELRVRTFLTEGITNLTKVYLFLLVDSEADARSFDQSFKETLNASLAERYRRQGDILNVRGNIHIAYISYENEESSKNIFVVDADGSIVQI